MRATKKLTFLAKYSYVFILLLIFLIMSFATDKFLTVDNLLNVARQSSMLLIMALGMTMAMLLGRGVDMSLGAIVSISSCFAAGFFLQSRGWESILLGILGHCHRRAGRCGERRADLLSASARHAGNLRRPGDSARCGLRLYERRRHHQHSSGHSLHRLRQNLRRHSHADRHRTALYAFGSVPAQVYAHGPGTYITGANPAAARFSGIKVDKNIIIGFVCSGVMAAIAGIIYVGRLGAAEAEIGTDFHFQAISAAAIGGISFNGGVGSPWGVVTGALILTLLNNAQNLLQISSAWQGFIYGATIIVAVLLDFFVRSQQTK